MGVPEVSVEVLNWLMLPTGNRTQVWAAASITLSYLTAGFSYFFFFTRSLSPFLLLYRKPVAARHAIRGSRGQPGGSPPSERIMRVTLQA